MKKRKWSVFSFPEEVGYKRLCEFAKEVGIDAIEPTQTAELRPNDPEKTAYVKEMLDKYGRKVSCYSVAANIAEENWESEMERLKSCMRTAAQLGCPYFHHTIFSRWSGEAPDADEIIEISFPRVKELCLYAKSLGMTDLFEDQGLVFNGKKNFTKFVNKLEAEYVPFGLVLDAGNAIFVDEDATEMMRDLVDKVVHVHVKDYHIKTTPFEDGGAHKTNFGKYARDIRMGLGDIDLDAVFALMDSVGYDGYFSLEYCGTEGLDGIKASLENLKARYETT